MSELKTNGIPFYDLIDTFVGIDDEDIPKAVLSFSIVDIVKTESGETDSRERTSFIAYPEVELTLMSCIGDFILLEIDFRYEANIWLNRLLEMFNEFQRIVDKTNTFFIATITSLKDDKGYYIVVMNPLCCLKGMTMDNRPTCVQMIFDASTFNLVEAEFDYESLKAEAIREALDAELDAEIEETSIINKSIENIYKQDRSIDLEETAMEKMLHEQTQKGKIRHTD